MSEDRPIKLTCPTCGHVWYERLSDLEKLDQAIYRSDETHKRVEQYRARCPRDHTYVIVEVSIEEDDDG